MKVLVITGDKNFKPGHPRFDLQAGAVERLEVLYWGRGSLWPRVPVEKFDVVTVQDPFWRGLFGFFVARRLGARLNVQVHTDLAAHSFLKRLLARFVLRRADSVRAVSQKIRTQVEQKGGRAPVVVLPVFVDLERFRAVEHHSEPGTILWIGRFELEKDPLLALNVLQQVPQAKLIMLGKGSLETVLRARAQRLSVEFPGWQDPLPYLARASVVLSTSQHESWGASMVEALAAGVPVVAPDVGIAREAGAVVVPSKQLAEAVTEVLQNDTRGELKLQLLSREEWVSAWYNGLR